MLRMPPKVSLMTVNANITCKGVDGKILKGKRVLKIHEEHPEVRIYHPDTCDHEISNRCWFKD